MRTMMHIWTKANEKLHVRLMRRQRKGGLVQYRNLALHIDPKHFYWERWPSRLIPFWKRGGRGIDFIEGIVSSGDPSVLQPLPGTPEWRDQDKRTSEILQIILEEQRTRNVFGGQKLDPLVIVILFLLVVIVAEGAMLFLGMR